MNRILLIAALCCLTSYTLFAQDGMGIGNSNPQEMLDVSGAIKIGGTLVGTADAGSIRWNGTNFQGYNGVIWVDLDGSAGADTDWTQSGVHQYSSVTGNVGIGTTSPTAKLHVVGTFQLVDGNQALGRVLTSDASGSATWQTPTPDTDTQNTLDQAYDEGGAGVGRSIAATDGAVRIDGQDGLVVTGTFSIGDVIEVTGSGTRMFFNPNKAAFRAGFVNGAQWDDANVGDYSFASGRLTTASGSNSTAMGSNTTASGIRSMALGTATTASGRNSTALGSGTSALSFVETVVGRFNTDYTPISTTSWNAADRLFVVGNGTGTGVNASDALVVLKDGKTGIGTSIPTSRLDVEGKTTTNSFKLENNAANNRVLVSDANGDATWTDPDNLAITELNWTGGGTGEMHPVTLTDEVGVGTNNPRAALEVSSDVDAVLGTNGSGIFRISRISNNKNLLFDADDIMARANNNTAGTLNLQRQNGDLDVGDGNLYVTSNALVGIGTNSPNYRLQLNRNSANDVFSQFTNSSTGVASSDGFLVGINGSGHAQIFQQETLEVRFGTGNVERMTIEADGEVGIATNNPRALLEIMSDDDAVLGTNASGIFRISNVTGSANLLMDVDDIMARSSNTSSGTLNLQRQNGDLDVGSGNLYVKSNGKVGIKTSTPNYSLQVNATGFNIDTYSQFTSDGTGSGANSGLLVGVNWTGNAQVMHQGDFDLSFGTNDTKRLVIKNDGKVGVGTSSPLSLFEVRGAGIDRSYSGDVGNYIAIFENTNTTGADGIAIQIEQNNADAENNFVTFVDGLDRIAGRIEGFQDYDWEMPPSVPFLNTSSTESIVSSYIQTNMLEPLEIPNLPIPDIVIGAQSLPSVNIPNFNVDLPSIDLGDLDLSSIGAGVWSLGSINPPAVNINLPNLSLPDLPSFTIPGFTIPGAGIQIPGAYVPSWYNDVLSGELPLSNSEIQDLMCWGVENDALDMVTMDPTELAMMGMKIAARQICNDGGVTYASKGADYAEWIPKEIPDQHFNIGEIVGVKNGHITKSTEDAEQIMIVSSRPIVLGNTPPVDKADEYVKVGFMGQVMTMVRGRVNVGDYIVPSGYNDGTAIAVSPEDITLDQISLVAGKAWENSEPGAMIGFINVAVGLKTNEWVDVLKKQSAEHQALEAKVEGMESEMERIKSAIGLDAEASGRRVRKSGKQQN